MSAAEENAAILEVADMRVWYGTRGDPVRAVDGVSFSIGAGRPSGSSASPAAARRALGRGTLGLLPPMASVSGSVRYDGRELVGMDPKELRDMRSPRARA